MSFIDRIILVFKYQGELKILLDNIREEARREERERRKEFVNLCEHHQPRTPGAHHDPANCDVCRLKA
jgi:hypothetical protein